MNFQGTPVTLTDAVERGIWYYMPKQELKIIAPIITLHVKDFLRQKIGAMMLDPNPNVVAAAEKLKEDLAL